MRDTAKIVIISCLVTLMVIVLVAYIARDFLVAYVVDNSPRDEVSIVTDAAEHHNASHQVVEAIERVNPAVVSVIVTKDVPVYERYYESFDAQGWFGSFSVPRVRESGTEEREVGGGSGFIVSNDGLIVTNRHVVDDNEAKYSVLLNDGLSYEVEVLARDVQLDIAVLQITEPLVEPLVFAQFGDSEALKLGEPVIAIGNALAEFRNSVSVGVVSGLARSIVARDGMGRTEELHEVIQTDAAINPGNSGGPLLNAKGEVIGVNVATSRGADNIGFALPAHEVKRVVDSVQEYGEIVRPFLGVRYVMINPLIATENNLQVDYGALVVGGGEENWAVWPNSPADTAGILEGDIIVAIDDVTLDDNDLARILAGKRVGDEVVLTVWQAGEQQTILVTLGRTL